MIDRSHFADDDARWQALVARAPAADGHFVYAVTTTGIYCRPGCPARQPKREHVAFFDSGELARAAGFRPCRRCRPEQPAAAQVLAEAMAALCRWLEHSDALRTLDELARRAGMSRFHLQRTFKRIVGVTPKQYQLQLRQRRVQTALRAEASVTDALYAAGYSSAGHFYGDSDATLGMTPKTFRTGGADVAIRYGTARCELGVLLVAASARGVCCVELGDAADTLVEALRQRYPRAALAPLDAESGEWLQQVLRWIERPRTAPQLPLDIQGTAFQRQVWQALREIPAGATASYADIAARIGRPGAARAVATACASNQLALLIPCHRVIRGSGELAGYRWGVERKRELLRRERSAGADSDD